MIFDGPTGIELIPGNGGKDCPVTAKMGMQSVVTNVIIYVVA